MVLLCSQYSFPITKNFPCYAWRKRKRNRKSGIESTADFLKSLLKWFLCAWKKTLSTWAILYTKKKAKIRKRSFTSLLQCFICFHNMTFENLLLSISSSSSSFSLFSLAILCSSFCEQRFLSYLRISSSPPLRNADEMKR